MQTSQTHLLHWLYDAYKVTNKEVVIFSRELTKQNEEDAEVFFYGSLISWILYLGISLQMLFMNWTHLNKVTKTVIVGFNIAMMGQTLVYGMTYMHLKFFSMKTSSKLDLYWLASQIDDQFCQLQVILTMKVYFSLKCVEIQMCMQSMDPISVIRMLQN